MEKLTNLEDIKKRFQSESGTIRPDDSSVIRMEMQINAIKELSNDTNGIFSQLGASEVFDVSRAYVFAADPLKSVSGRLKSRGIAFRFELPVLTHFLDENIKHRHKIDRKRVDEYIEGLKAVAPRTTAMQEEQKRTPIMNRLI